MVRRLVTHTRVLLPFTVSEQHCFLVCEYVLISTELATMENPPLRCIVGSDAYTAINAKLDNYRDNVKKYEKLSNSTDAEGYERPS